MEALQKQLRHQFRDPGLLETALTHSSYANERRCASNERLEFVGDSVLGMVTAAQLYRSFPDRPEGKLTRLRAELVCERSLHAVAQELQLGRRLRLGRGEEISGGRTRPSILADCVEAVIAALYLDGGLPVAADFIERHILCRIPEADALLRDYKTELQELVQQKPGRSVSYILTGERGPDHNKRFTVSALVEGRTVGDGEGRTKKEAEQMAARCALEHAEAWI